MSTKWYAGITLLVLLALLALRGWTASENCGTEPTSSQLQEIAAGPNIDPLGGQSRLV